MAIIIKSRLQHLSISKHRMEMKIAGQDLKADSQDLTPYVCDRFIRIRCFLLPKRR